MLNEFSELTRKLDEQKALLKALVSEREGRVADLRNMRSATIKADDIASILAYVEHLHEREKQQEEVIRQTGEAVEEKRKYLVEAVKNRKVMENLKDRHEQDYIKDFNETEQKNSDEMSVLKFGRRVK